MNNNVTAQPVDTKTLVDLLRWRAERQPQRHAYTFLRQGGGEVRLTYAELDRQARAIGALLQAKGATGKPVLLLHTPGIHYVVAIFGCMCAGALAVPAYPPHSLRMVPRIQAILASTRSNFIATTAETLPGLRRNLAHLPDLQPMEWIATDALTPALGEEWYEPSIDADTIAFLQYTSGSTAVPKGVMVSHSNLQHNLEIMTRHCQQTADSHIVSWLPPYHDLGLICGILFPFYVGFPSTLLSPMAFLQRPFRWLQAISSVHATMSMAPNFAYDLCVRKITSEQRATLDLSSLQVAATGGEPPREETMIRFAETFAARGFRWNAFFPGYGMAETTLVVATNHADLPPVIGTFDREALERNEAVPLAPDAENARRVAGYELFAADQEVIIADPETLKQCSGDRVGEIWVRGPSVTRGYWRNAEETRHAYHAYRADTGEGPFLRTGDLGFIQQETLFVTGRLKDLIIIHGRNHYPQDIELTVEQSHFAMRKGCCVAFSIEANNQEQLVVLAEIEPRYLALKPEEEQRANTHGLCKFLDPQEVSRALRQAIAEEHELQVYQVVLLRAGGVFKTSSGKLQRRACRAAFLTGSLNVWDK